MTTHVPFIAKGVRVFFPFEPYDVQRQYVEKVIEALSGRHNALLESPTGTGKTLSLICSTLAWLQSSNSKSVIYYTSRTHLQLSQAAKEMKKTAYARVPSVVIGSRAKMCLNDDVRGQPENLINRSCRNAIAKNACAYHSGYDQKMASMNHDTVHDIEDLLSLGKTHQCCPYYTAKKIAAEKASVVFMPYNYLLDGAVRKSQDKLKISDSVIIFDEAHNIESSLKDCVSGLFTLKGLKSIQESCRQLPSKLSDALTKEKHGLSRTGYDPSEKRNGIVDEFAPNKSNNKPEKEVKPNPIEELAEKLTMERIRQVDECAKALESQTCTHFELDKPGSIEKFFHLMKISGVDYSTSNIVIETLDSMASFWSIAGVMSPTLVARYVSAIGDLSNVVSLLYPETCLSVIRQQNNEAKLIKFYSSQLTAIRETTRAVREGRVVDWELHLWCLHPAIGLQRVIDSTSIKGPRSIVITSGTLAPTQAMIKELEIEFKVVKEFGHVISGSQLKIFAIDKSPEGYSLESRFEDITKDEYPNALGKTLIPLFQVLPYGTLVIVPSYNILDRVIKYWKDKSNIWRDMTATTTIFIESKTSQDNFNRDLAAYRSKISNGGTNSRAVFFGVCRGKLSEGTNLEGNHCRSVIVTGLPFPSLKDARVESTRKFHNRYAVETKQPDPNNAGTRWYKNQMLRAVNQTAGRVIRSKSDFGVLFLLDPRFMQFRHSMSKWVWQFFPQQPVRVECIQTEIKQFYADHGITITDTASNRCGAFDIDLAPATIDPNNWSFFSDESTSTKNSRTNGSQSNGNGQSRQISESTPITTVTRTSQDRQEFLSKYTVDKETYDRAKSRVRKPTSENDELVEKSKRLKTTDYLESIYEATQSCTQDPPQTQPQPQSQSSSSSTPSHVAIIVTNNIRSDGTIRAGPTALSQAGNKGESGLYKCELCKHPAEHPLRTNCTCARIGCRKCLRILDDKACGTCQTELHVKKMKPLLFESALGKEKAKPKKAVNIFKKK